MNGSIEYRFKTEHTYLNRTLQKLSSKMTEYTVPKTFNKILLLSFAKAHMIIELFRSVFSAIISDRQLLEEKVFTQNYTTFC